MVAVATPTPPIVPPRHSQRAGCRRDRGRSPARSGRVLEQEVSTLSRCLALIASNARRSPRAAPGAGHEPCRRRRAVRPWSPHRLREFSRGPALPRAQRRTCRSRVRPPCCARSTARGPFAPKHRSTAARLPCTTALAGPPSTARVLSGAACACTDRCGTLVASAGPWPWHDGPVPRPSEPSARAACRARIRSRRAARPASRPSCATGKAVPGHQLVEPRPGVTWITAGLLQADTLLQAGTLQIVFERHPLALHRRSPATTLPGSSPRPRPSRPSGETGGATSQPGPADHGSTRAAGALGRRCRAVPAASRLVAAGRSVTVSACLLGVVASLVAAAIPILARSPAGSSSRIAQASKAERTSPWPICRASRPTSQAVSVAAKMCADCRCQVSAT